MTPDDNGNKNKNEEETDDETTLRKTLASLDVQRKAIEHEADAIYLELSSPPAEGVEPMGLDTPLVDKDGYPRGDIDVYRTRTQRNRFRVLKTDHKEMEEQIEGLLLQLASLKDPSKKKEESDEHARRVAPKPSPKFDALTGKWVVMNWDGSVAGVQGGDKMSFADLSKNREDMQISDNTTDNSRTSNNDNIDEPMAVMAENSNLPIVDETTRMLSSTSIQQQQQQQRLQRRPFAKVDAVADESPAEESGMKMGDLVTRFGSINADNHDRLRAVAYLVPEVAGEGGTIPIDVLRRCYRQGNDDDDDNSNNFDDETQWEKLTLSPLRPRPFAGRGMLGCHIVPYDP